MRLRNNPKAYEIKEENADLVILKPEEHKGHYHDIFEINQPRGMEKRGMHSYTLLCRKKIHGIYERNKDTIQGVYHDE